MNDSEYSTSTLDWFELADRFIYAGPCFNLAFTLQVHSVQNVHLKISAMSHLLVVGVGSFSFYPEVTRQGMRSVVMC